MHRVSSGKNLAIRAFKVHVVVPIVNPATTDARTHRGVFNERTALQSVPFSQIRRLTCLRFRFLQILDPVLVIGVQALGVVSRGQLHGVGASKVGDRDHATREHHRLRCYRATADRCASRVTRQGSGFPHFRA